MEIHEYQAKAIFKQFGIKILRSELISHPQQVETVMQNWIAPFGCLKPRCMLEEEDWLEE